jgi:hypothetical protein
MADFDPVLIGITPVGVKWVAYSPAKVESMRTNFKRMAEHQAKAIHLDIPHTTWRVLEDIAGGSPSLGWRGSHLKSLRIKGLIRKNTQGKWELTRKGKQVLELASSGEPIKQRSNNPGPTTASASDLARKLTF